MSRKKFIESQGASCKNWYWSWSFVNHDDKFVIFGAWNINTTGNSSLILSESWKFNAEGKKQAAYDQSLEHIKLIEDKGYALKTFPMKFSSANKDKDDNGPAKIDGFTPELTDKLLKRVGGKWYASDGVIGDTLPEEVVDPDLYSEGATKAISVNTFERSAEARNKCLEHHGYKCAVCEFDFESVYGSLGKAYIHVHHIVPISEIRAEYKLSPISDLVPVCPNCHAMIHRTTPVLTIEELKTHMRNI